VSLCPLLFAKVCPLSVNTSHCTVCWFCVTISTALPSSPSTTSQYLTLHCLFILCRYCHCCLLMSVHFLSVPLTVPSACSVLLYSLQSCKVCPLSVIHKIVPCVGSVSLCPLLSSRACPLSVSTSHCTVCWFCVSISTAGFCSVSNVRQYFTLYCLLALSHCVHCCLLQSVHYLSVPHTVPSVASVSLCPLFPFTVCPLSVSTFLCTVCCFCFTMSTAVF